MTLSGTTENLYTGTTTVNAGELDLSKSNSSIAVQGPLVVNAGSIVKYTAANQVKDDQSITVGSLATLNMGTFSDQVGGITINNGSILGSGTLTINGDITSDGVASIMTKLYIKEVSRTVTVNSGKLTLGGAVSSIFNAGLVKEGPGILVLTASSNTLQGGITANGGTAIAKPSVANGALGGSLVANAGATIGGNATVTGVTLTGGTFDQSAVAATATTLTSTGNAVFDSASNFNVRLFGPVATNDKLNVTGTVNLGGATLNITSSTAAVGKTFTIIHASVKLIGTFAGLPNNATFFFGLQQFKIQYLNGNKDVVLTRLS
jgi:autotransporter-associated beta strand protein